MHIRIKQTVLLGLAGVLLLVAGCATGKPAPVLEVVWPLPPEVPRVKFVKTITSSKAVGGKPDNGLMRKLLGQSSGGTAFSKPYGVHVDRDGRLMVADTGWGKVLVFDFATESFWVLGVDGRGVLNQPVSVTSDSAGRIYVSDGMQSRVVVYDRDGNFLNAFGGREYLSKPVGMVVDEQRDSVYVVDTKRHHVVVFNLAGEYQRTFGEHGPEEGMLNWPTNIALAPNGELYVVDMLNFRVQIFGPDGKFLRKFGGIGRGFGNFSKPKGIGVDRSGHVFVADAAFNNVQIFDDQGHLLLFFGGMGAGPGQFWMPAGVAVGPDQRVYVADQFNRRVNVYELLPVTEEPVPEGS